MARHVGYRREPYETLTGPQARAKMRLMAFQSFGMSRWIGCRDEDGTRTAPREHSFASQVLAAGATKVIFCDMVRDTSSGKPVIDHGKIMRSETRQARSHAHREITHQKYRACSRSRSPEAELGRMAASG